MTIHSFRIEGANRARSAAPRLIEWVRVGHRSNEESVVQAGEEFGLCCATPHLIAVPGMLATFSAPVIADAQSGCRKSGAPA
jgi:hypothetical protein